MFAIGGGGSTRNGLGVGGGVANSVLYVDASGNLKADDANIAFNATTAKLNLVMGNSATRSPAITTATIDTAEVGNVGTGEDNLITYLLPASCFAATAKGLRLRAWGTGANNDNAKIVRMYFGATAVASANLTASQANQWNLEAEIYSTGANAQDFFSSFIQTGAANVLISNTGTLIHSDAAIATCKCTGEASANNDIVQTGFSAIFIN